MTLQKKMIYAIRAAVKSGEILIKNYSEEKKFRIKSKFNRDISTRIDIESENEILKILKKDQKQPANFLFEENTYLEFYKNSKFTWIIDALDGTVNYIHKIPYFCTSIALKDNESDKIIFGVIYNPLSNELYYSHHDGSVFKNANKVYIDDNSISKSLIAISLSSNHTKEKNNELQIFKKLNFASQGVLRTGSAGMNLAYFSEGRFSACIGFENKIWDVASGLILAEKNGAKIYYKYKNKKKTIISFIVANKNNYQTLYDICKKII